MWFFSESARTPLSAPANRTLLAPLIAPDDCGTQRLIAISEQYGAMHLAGQTYASDDSTGKLSLRQRFANRARGGMPPVMRVLFCPSRVGRCKWLVVFCSRGCDPPVLGDQDGTGTSCAEI